MLNLEKYESIYATSGHGSVSDRYSFISTAQILDQLGDHGWLPSKVEQSAVRKESFQGYQKHLIRLQNESLNTSLVCRDEIPEIILINSHMRSSRLVLALGIFRFVCSNGLMVGDNIQSFKITHLGDTENDVKLAVNLLGLTAPQVFEQVQHFKAIELNQDEQRIFAEQAIELKLGEDNKYAISPESALHRRRYADTAPTLWNTFNVVQENLVKGGIRQRNSLGRRSRTRPVKAIDKNVALNKALWTLTEKMAELKAAN